MSRKLRCSRNVGLQQGLTLIEVLTVIVVIGILSALLIPAVRQAMHRARSAQCRANLEDIGNALVTYVNDNGTYPRSIDGVPAVLYAEGDEQREQVEIQGEGSVMKIEQCPNAPEPEVFEKARKRYMDYGYNAVGLGGMASEPHLGLGFKGKSSTPVPEGDVNSPARMIAYGDGFKAWNNVIIDNQWPGRAPSALKEKKKNPKLYRKAEKRVRRRHSGHVHFVFCDGHTERMTIEEAFFETNGAALSRWNRDNKPHRKRIQ